MGRIAEAVRQWTILREIERRRGAGATIDDFAALCDVTTRTIRRDIQALEEAGFPIYGSMGVHSGPPERVEVEFQPAVADYVSARE